MTCNDHEFFHQRNDELFIIVWEFNFWTTADHRFHVSFRCVKDATFENPTEGFFASIADTATIGIGGELKWFTYLKL